MAVKLRVRYKRGQRSPSIEVKTIIFMGIQPPPHPRMSKRTTDNSCLRPWIDVNTYITIHFRLLFLTICMWSARLCVRVIKKIEKKIKFMLAFVTEGLLVWQAVANKYLTSSKALYFILARELQLCQGYLKLLPPFTRTWMILPGN